MFAFSNIPVASSKQQCVTKTKKIYCLTGKFCPLTFITSSFTGKSIDPDGVKVGEDGYDDVEYARFTRLYNSYDKIPPAKEKLKHFRGVESNLFYLVSLLLENDVELLDQGDFVEQVMSQFAGQPVQMMTYAESVIAERAVARRSPPITTLTTDSMDTTRDHSKRRREEPPLTRQQSRNNVLEGID